MKPTIAILIARSDAVITYGDPHMVSIALENVLRNAVEATRERESDAPVLVNFGLTERDSWISVLDDGIGLPEGADRIFEIGRTTKLKGPHQGMGLATVKRAMESLAGSVDLRPRTFGGVECYISWRFDLR